MESLKVYILVANRMYNDGVRSALGLAVENHYGYPVILNGEFPSFSEYMKENIAWIMDMEGQVYSCGAPVPEETYDAELEENLMKEIDLKELGEAMREADYIIPYGIPKQSYEPPPACAE